MERQPSLNGPAHILLVDDDPAQLADIWGILETLGYKITAAESAEAALRRVEQTRFDMILTDNILPGMTGLQALPRLRAAGTPVIVMSSSTVLIRRRTRSLLEPLPLSRNRSPSRTYHNSSGKRWTAAGAPMTAKGSLPFNRECAYRDGS